VSGIPPAVSCWGIWAGSTGLDPAGFTGCSNPTNVANADGIFTTEKGRPAGEGLPIFSGEACWP